MNPYQSFYPIEALWKRDQVKFTSIDLAAEKLKLIHQIISSDDVSLIVDVKSMISKRDMDWFDRLNKIQQGDVVQGIHQLDSGKVLSHEEAKIRFRHKE